MGALGKVMAFSRQSVPFTLGSYDQAFVPSGPGALSVTPESAMKIATVYACVAIISESIASVPLDMYQFVDPDGKKPAGNHPLQDVLHDQPNDYQTALEFREMMTAFALLRPRAIAEIKPGPRGPVDQLVPLHPDLVSREITSDGQVRYRYQDPVAHKARILLSDEVFVVTARFGRSVLEYARDSFGLALAQEKYATDLFLRGARPTGTLTVPGKLNPQGRRNLRKALDRYALGGQYSGRPLLLQDGMTWNSIGISNKDAEFLESRQFSVAEVARWFRVPLHKVQDLSKATNNNIEQQAIEFVTDTLRPWAERWEQSIRRDLIIAKALYFAEHNLDGLLRGDIKTRYEAFGIGRQWGWLCTNDIRRRENMSPIDGGDDDFLTPLNMMGGGNPALTPAAPARADTVQPAVVAQLQAMVYAAAGRAVRKEVGALGKLSEQTGAAGEAWEAGVAAFYADHGPFVAKLLHLADATSAAYAADRLLLVLDGGVDAIEDIETAVSQLADLAMTNADLIGAEAVATSADESPQRSAA